MSVKVMGMVFEHYPEGGGEMLLALALADFSDDDGGHVFPSIATLAKKTRQSVRSVQYQLRRMEHIGFISVVDLSVGGRINGNKYKSTEYKIHLDYLTIYSKIELTDEVMEVEENVASLGDIPNGESSAPLTETCINTAISTMGANFAPLTERCNPERLTVQSESPNGAITVAPNPSCNPPYKPPLQHARDPDHRKPDLKVGMDLIFPFSIQAVQRDAIREVLASSGVTHGHWQTLIDELHGALLAKPIGNPIGYVRILADRIKSGSFTPERAPLIAEQRRKREADDQRAAFQATKPSDNEQSIQAQFDRLPIRMRESLTRMMPKKSQERI